MSSVRADEAVLAHRGRTMVLTDGHNPPISVRTSGRRASLPVRRKDGTIGLRRPRNGEERQMVSDNQTVRALLTDPAFWAAADQMPGNSPIRRLTRGRPAGHPTWVRWMMACVAGLLGSQRAAVAYFADPVTWDHLRVWVHPHIPEGWAAPLPSPPTRWTLRRFQKQWERDDWRDIRGQVEKALLGAALTQAKRQGHFEPCKPLSYNHVDPTQWVTVDGTVLRAPSDQEPDQGKRTDEASGLHSYAGSTKRGSKFVLVESASEDYRGRYILAVAHVTPKPGREQGDEAAPTVRALIALAEQAPGLRGAISDSVLRGLHIEQLYKAGLVTVNYPVAASNPNRDTGGRNAPGRVERESFIRVHRHTLSNGTVCEHRLHTVGSVPHQIVKTVKDDVLRPLPAAKNGYCRTNKNGTRRWYVEYTVPCKRGDTLARLRIDGPARNDSRDWSYADIMRFYPVGTTQFGILYGRRNATESVHRQYKRKAERVPAYGHIRQTLYVLGYAATHNAVARALHLRRNSQPNALDGNLRT